MSQAEQIGDAASAGNEAGRAGGLAGRIKRYPGRASLAAFFVVMTALVFVLPAAPFSIDNFLYFEMARAMAEEGSFALVDPGRPVGAPPLTLNFTYAIEGEVYPQYPGGYALVAAPFYAVGGFHGLVMLNVLAACVCAALTFRIAVVLYGEREAAWLASGLFAGASFAAVYALGVWPHLLTLALILCGVERAAAAGRDGEARPLLALAFGGLAFGLALNVRVDALFPAAAVLIWLRLFAFPGRRLAALAFVAGFAPGLLLASGVNWVKFGDPSPFSYGPKEGLDSAAAYGPLILAAVVGAVALFVFDARWRWVGDVVARVRTRNGALVALGLLVVGLLLVPAVRTLAFNMYVLVFDLQRLSPETWQPGVERGADGVVTFWGRYKKALVQSLPWIALAIGPVWAFVRGEQARAHALMLGVIAAPIVFYSLNQWHGGLSYSMRYFLPAVPMLAVLAGLGLRRVLGNQRAAWRRAAMTAVAVVACGAPLVATAAVDPFRDAAWMHYLPASVVALGLGVCVVLLLVRPGMAAARRGASLLAGAAVGLAVLINLFDLTSVSHRKGHVAMLDRAMAAAVPTDALVVSGFNEAFGAARLGGAGVLDPASQSGEAVRDAISAYRLAGRCVYAYPATAIDAVDGASRSDWRRSEIPGLAEAFGGIYQPVDQGQGCDP